MAKIFTCPYCFEKSSLAAVKYRCQSSPAKCALEPDAVLSQHMGLRTPTLQKRVIEKKKEKFSFKSMMGGGAQVRCDQCEEISNTKICPRCHNELPHTLDKTGSFFFAIAGAPSSGKTHYIASLIIALRGRLGHKFNCNLQALNDITIQTFNDVYKKPLYEGKTIDKTQPGFKNPLHYSLSFLNGRNKISSTTTMSFFDTAGENLSGKSQMAINNKYIYNSSGILLLIDPLQLRGVRAKINSNKIDLEAKTTDPIIILESIINLIKSETNVSGKIEIPIAIVFSKIDALDDILDEDNSLKYESDHEGYFNLAEFNDVNNTIQDMLGEWQDDEDIINIARHNFSQYAFFGVSALGCHPGKSNVVTHLKPRRVEDPFLWLLYANKLIKAKK